MSDAQTSRRPQAGTPSHVLSSGGRAYGYIDSHVHWWDQSVLSYDWLNAEPDLPSRRIGQDLAQVITDADSGLGPLLGVIAVEAGIGWAQAEDEVRWLISAETSQVPLLGIVAAAQVEAQSVKQQLERLTRLPQVVGVRRLLQDELTGFISSPEMVAGVRAVGAAGLPFDVCVRSHQLDEVVRLVDAAPDTTFVLNHLGKPFAGSIPSLEWLDSFKRLADRPHVVCKLSGLATEAGGVEPDVTKLVAFLAVAIDIFGADRCMFGSDWPVSATRMDHDTWRRCVESVLENRKPATRAAVARGTAERVYGLSVPAGRRNHS